MTVETESRRESTPPIRRRMPRAAATVAGLLGIAALAVTACGTGEDTQQAAQKRATTTTSAPTTTAPTTAAPTTAAPTTIAPTTVAPTTAAPAPAPPATRLAPVRAPRVAPPPPPPAPAPAPAPPIIAGPTEGQVGQFLALLNAARAQHGLAPLGWNGQLANLAQSWSASMASQGALSHQDLNSKLAPLVPGWRGLAENVGMGPSVEVIHNTLLGSPNHKANMMGDFNQVGIGFANVNGYIWVTFDFAKS